MTTDKQPKTPSLSEDEVLAYLQRYPDFLTRHPELFEQLVPPAQRTGERVADFQQFAIRNLQQRIKKAESQFSHALTYARENISTQSQVHEAVMKLIRVRGLEDLLECITQDMQSLFDVDVVRLGLESELADLYDSYHPEEHYSGLVFIGAGAVDTFFGDKRVLLFSDSQERGGFLIEELFLNCQRLAASCALLRLDLPGLDRAAVIGFGVRTPGRYDEQQGSELLMFLGKVMGQRLDTCLLDNGVHL